MVSKVEILRQRRLVSDAEAARADASALMPRGEASAHLDSAAALAQGGAEPTGSEGGTPRGGGDMEGIARRSSLTGEMKREICELKQRSDKMSQDMIVAEMETRHGVRLSRTTVCKILKDSPKWLTLSEAEARQKRQRLGKFPDLEDELIEWFREILSQRPNMVDSIIVDKAKHLALDRGIPPTDFKMSDGWLSRFKRRISAAIQQQPAATRDAQEEQLGGRGGEGDDSEEDAAPSRKRQRWNPSAYRKSFSFVPTLGLPVVDLLAPLPGERVLDLGCGEGTLSKFLSALGCHVVGVDSSPDMVEMARRDGVNAILADACHLQFSSEFDCVFSNAALHWMKRDPSLVVANVRAALKPGGRFVAEMGGFGNVASLVTALVAVLRARGIDAAAVIPWYFPTEEEYRNLLESHGFEVECMELIARPTLLPDGVASWLDAFAQSFFAGLSEADKNVVYDEIHAALQPALCDSEGRWFGDYVRLRFRASLPALPSPLPAQPAGLAAPGQVMGMQGAQHMQGAQGMQEAQGMQGAQHMQGAQGMQGLEAAPQEGPN
ncbi:hypothetical protein CLOM_g10016 [Closterium sp. NIES-68]|nr:hypothetical protein CLOM_g6506 [Closterium sp. NIES-68]GJP50862.1 hypothetical protein CLOM_g10016 [Closterium sp. NIES-68]GJP68376.1 hypothetical protein CLOP_g25097 [Closterium sp. NIES-67]